MAPWKAQSSSGLSLIFKPGQRPAVADLVRLLASEDRLPGLAVSFQPEPSQGWLELLAEGLTFDLVGLAPAASAEMPETGHWYGFSEVHETEPVLAPAEVITLFPGDQLRGAENLLSVVRIMAAIAIRLAGLPNVQVVVWHPARTAMAPDVFLSAIGNWLKGGTFPAIGLTALFRDGDGAMCSEGLAFFIGHELRIERSTGKNTAQDAKIAARLVNELVGSDAIQKPLEFTGPNGEYFSIAPPGDDGFLRVCRRG